jgi:hypothetical protein
LTRGKRLGAPAPPVLRRQSAGKTGILLSGRVRLGPGKTGFSGGNGTFSERTKFAIRAVRPPPVAPESVVKRPNNDSKRPSQHRRASVSGHMTVSSMFPLISNTSYILRLIEARSH